MKNMKRSVRRHHYARLKAKWDKIATRSWYYDRLDEEWAKNYTAMLVTTHTMCSCWMCRNERQSEGPTLQEIRNLLSHEEDLMGL